MTPTHTKRGRKRYRYYTCSAGLKVGRASCPTPNLNASTVEQLVVQQIARVGQDPSLFQSVIAEYRGLLDQQASERDIEDRLLRQELKSLQTEEQRLLAAIQPNQANEPILKRLQQLAAKRDELQAKLAQLQRETPASLPPEDKLREQLARFEPLWKKLTTSEQERLLKLLIDRIDYHADRGSIRLHFHPTAFKTLGELKK